MNEVATMEQNVPLQSMRLHDADPGPLGLSRLVSESVDLQQEVARLAAPSLRPVSKLYRTKNSEDVPVVLSPSELGHRGEGVEE